MTHQEKFEELKEEYNIDKYCKIIINEGENQVVYSVTDEEDNCIVFDFNLETKTFGTIIDECGKLLYEEEIREF